LGHFVGDEIPEDRNPASVQFLLDACLKYRNEVDQSDFISELWIPRLERFLK
jgi:hypothetical protein